VAVFNKDESRVVDLSIRAPRPIETATVWRMQAPALDSTEGVTLAGAQIEAHAQWSPKITEPVAIQHGMPRISVPAGSAALLFLV